MRVSVLLDDDRPDSIDYGVLPHTQSPHGHDLVHASKQAAAVSADEVTTAVQLIILIQKQYKYQKQNQKQKQNKTINPKTITITIPFLIFFQYQTLIK